MNKTLTAYAITMKRIRLAAPLWRIFLLGLLPLLAFSPAEANFKQGGGKNCLGCHTTDFSAAAGNNFFVSVRGVDLSSAVTFSVRPGEIFDIDYYFETPQSSYTSVGVQTTVPPGWAVSTGSTATAPAAWPNWNSNWDQGAGGFWQVTTNLADSYTVRFASPIPWDSDGTGGGKAEDTACNNGGDCNADGITDDLDGVANRMGSDLKVTASTIPGSYTLSLYGVYAETSGRGYIGKTYTIIVDGTSPTITNVSSSAVNGTYEIGDTIVLTVTFSEPVNVTGTPVLLLETGTTDRNAAYTGGGTTDTLTFSYTVQVGDTSPDLDYPATDSLALNGGTIVDQAGNNAILTLPAPGLPGSLGANKDLVINGHLPLLLITKTVDKNNAAPGEILTYSVNYHNSGMGAAYNVVVIDTVPEYTTYMADSLRIGNAASSYATATPLTDTAGDDEGEFNGSQATFSIGPVPGDDGVAGSGLDEGKVYLRLMVN